LELYKSLPGIRDPPPVVESEETEEVATTSTEEDAEEETSSVETKEEEADETADEEETEKPAEEAEEVEEAEKPAEEAEEVAETSEAADTEIAAETDDADEAAEEEEEESTEPVEQPGLSEMESRRRKLLKRSDSSSSSDTVKDVKDKEKSPRAVKSAPVLAVAAPSPKKGTYVALQKYEALGSEHKVDDSIIQKLRNLTEYESICQFSTRECAQQSAQELATLLRANAQLVADAEYGSNADLQRVTQGLADLRSNYRMTMNQTALDSVGIPGSMGKCAVIGRGEFDDAGVRYTKATSRFAEVIDMHDTMVYCSAKSRKCIFSGLRAPKVRKVEMDTKAWETAAALAEEIHAMLAADEELGAGVVGWGHAGESTATFVSTLVLLRSGLCDRVDMYGESERPSSWLKVVGNGHLVSEPGESWADKKLALQLQQERYVYRLVSQATGGNMCFFQ
ncbi:hypothetical protein CYMTET_42445, partial [Cymbomonas tetramitiformis]